MEKGTSNKEKRSGVWSWSKMCLLGSRQEKEITVYQVPPITTLHPSPACMPQVGLMRKKRDNLMYQLHESHTLILIPFYERTSWLY